MRSLLARVAALVTASCLFVLAGCAHQDATPGDLSIMPSLGTGLGQMRILFLPFSGRPSQIVAGPDGALWFTEPADAKIARVTIRGWFSERATPHGLPLSIASSAHKLWYAEPHARIIGSVSPEFSFGHEYVMPRGAEPTGVTIGPDGAAWFTLSGINQVGRFGVKGGATYCCFTGTPTGITGGPDGALWITEPDSAKIARFKLGAIIEFGGLLQNSQPNAIVSCSGALWFTESGSPNIGRITTTGHVREYHLLSKSDRAAGAACDSHGVLWFTERNKGAIGRLSRDGRIVEYKVPFRGAAPVGITRGPDGGMWFADAGIDAIGRIQP